MWEDSRVQGKMRFCKAICEKIYSLQMSRNGVCVVGLYGMGGIGKTTICKALCNEMFMEFKGVVCHLQLGSGTKLELMQEVLKKLSNKSYDGLLAFNEDKCRHYLHRELKKQRIFLVIDNVSDSLMAMQQAKDFLNIEHSSGSIVLVAARSLVQLINLHMDESTCFEMPNMFEEEARSLFLYHAAPQIEVDEELLRQCIKRCYFMKGNGRIGFYHPLALKVLGLQFRMTNPKEWPQQLDAMLKEEFNQLRNNEHPIFSIFRKSYDTLEHEDQVLFMDAALYCPERLIGSNWWSNMFEWLGMVHNISVPVVIRRLKVLKMKCLIEDVGDGSTRICVHDLWHQFCKAEPEFDRRFVYHNQEILKQHSLSDGGWEGLRRVCLRGNGLLSSTVKTVNLSHCRNLGVLKLVGVDIEDHLLDLRPLEKMKSLEILFGLFPFPKGSSVAVLGLGTQSNLSVLKWDNIPSQSPCIEEIGCLTNLQVLHLESGQNKNKMPNVGSLILLKEAKINFSDGADTIEGLSSKMGKLRYLDLGGCHGLRNCPGVADLVALEELDLCGCSMLRELPNLQKLTKLRKLDITGCQSIKALLGLGELVSLQELRAGRCWGLDEFPDLFMLTNLQVLDILYVYSEHVRGLDNLLALEELRVDAPRSEGWPDVSKFTRLETLVVNGWAPHRLPSATMITKLKRLTILHCSGLHELAGLWKMRGLKALSIRHCEFKDVSDLRHLTALQHLEIHDCGDLERLPDLHTLTRLELLDVMDCRSLRHWEGVSTALQYSFRAFEPDRVGPLSQLENLKLRGLPVAQIPDLSNFPRLKALDLVHCGGLKSLNSTGPLTALEDLRLYGCTSLQALPDLSCSTRLKSFILYNCGVQLTLKEIEKIKAMCPALMLDKSILSDMESEKIQY